MQWRGRMMEGRSEALSSSASFQDFDIRSSCLILSPGGECKCFMKWEHVDRTWTVYCVANSLTNCFTMWAMAEFTTQTHSHLRIGIRKKTERTKGREAEGKTEFGQDAAICPRKEAIFMKSQKVSLSKSVPVPSLIVDLWPRPWLEHILDAGSSGDHCMQVWWRSSYLSGRRSDLCKMFRPTDGRRTPRDWISSWNGMS